MLGKATVTKYFITFLQTVNVTNSYQFSFRSTNNIIFFFSLINNQSSYQQFEKKKCKLIYNSSIFHELKCVSATRINDY